MKIALLQKHPVVKDIVGIVLFIVAVFIGTAIINAFIFRTFSVDGPSMEETLHTGDRLIVNRLPNTWASIIRKDYVPERGQVIVFKNPKFGTHSDNKYIVKRVIAFPGERVTVHDGKVTVYNETSPTGFNPDIDYARDAKDFTSGEVDVTVADKSLFVMGDNREGNYSCDSRNCLGQIPLEDIVGPVELRIYPFTKLRSF